MLRGFSALLKWIAVPAGAAFLAMGFGFAADVQTGLTSAGAWRWLMPTPAMAQERRLSIAQARNLGFSLLDQGQPQAAKLVAQGLLQRDAGDVSGLLILSRAERLLSDYRAATRAGRQAWEAATTPMEQYAAALVTAQAISAGGSKLRAQFWLRRATQVAPSAALRAKAVRDFRYLRATSLASVRLRFSVAPSSNINNGSRSETVNIGGLDFLLSGDARALSGIEYSAGATLRYNLGASGRLRQALSLDLDARAFTLSSSARSQAPDARAGDYAFQQVALGYDLTLSDAAGRAQNFAAVGLGANWFGGEALTHFFRATAGRRVALSPRNTLRWSLSGERQWRLDADERSATVWTLAGGWYRALKSGDRLSTTAYLRDTSAASAAIAHQALGGTVSYSVAKPLFGQTGLSLSLGLEARAYDQPFIGGVMREDTRASLSASMVFGDVDYYGFSPSATLSASRTASNVDLYDTRDVGIKFGLVSSF